ncbi:hypothetical protein [Flavobacterium chilense]|uniref:DUF4836 domain-containing protein n=1 Tax=Flavobacterium chilense TaxID=946677 RepID=A0A1M7CYM3_9FLAO|nr:hypothetical protein [Flavobacterium chilense]SHL71989.1 hypothetical protein SAMN05444484_102342 [Flavobacterium chilense]
MKQFYTFIFLFATYLTFGQNQNQYDYFVQFNGNQLSKKVSIAEILNHPIVTKYSSKKPDLDFTKYTSLIRLDQKITIHGKFSDSIPYYQVTIPIKNREAVKQFLTQELITKKDSPKTNTIQDLGSYSVLKTNGKNKAIGWNDNYLVIFELTQRLPSVFYTDKRSQTLNDSIDINEIYKEEAVEAPQKLDTPMSGEESKVKKSSTTIEAPIATEEVPVPYDAVPNAEYTIEQATFDREQAEKLDRIIKTLFENGFTAPGSEKINANADISSWINYSAAMTSLYSAYSYPMAIFGGYDKFLPMQKNFGNFIKGLNLDFYFDNNNARIEEVFEYSEQLAEVVGKITNRKINKNVFHYFPAQNPLGYMSYHLNTKAALENFPSLTADVFQSPKLLKEDISIITDLISTIVDEEATATLFDGDLSAFLCGFKDIEVMTKSYEYGENYEEVVTDKKVKKSVPLFSVIFTSTHPTFGDKLLQLGVRKKVLVQKDNYYIITGTKEYGDVFIKKDKDVVVIANTLDYFNAGNGTFANEAKRDLKKNYMFGKLSIAELINAYSKSGEAKPSEVKSLQRLSEQFSDITFESPKKMINNKLIFGFKLNALKSDKNIILQTLDLAEELTAK